MYDVSETTVRQRPPLLTGLRAAMVVTGHIPLSLRVGYVRALERLHTGRCPQISISFRQ